MQKILFIDRDGTLIEEPADYQVDALEKVRLVPGVMAALQRLRDIGYRFVMVSNQDGLGTSSFPQEQFELCQSHTLALFESCLLYTSPSPRDTERSRMPSSA